MANTLTKRGIMKIVSLLMVSAFMVFAGDVGATEPAKHNCVCKECQCNAEDHCGCFNEESRFCCKNARCRGRSVNNNEEEQNVASTQCCGGRRGRH
jgi:hypothetical protein